MSAEAILTPAGNDSLSADDVRSYGTIRQGDPETIPEVERPKGNRHASTLSARQRLVYILPTLVVATFLAAVDSTIVASTSAKIGTDFDALNRTSWLATGYLLTKVCVEPLYGKLSDIYGRKPLLLLSFAIFALGCAVSGVAGSLPMLIFGRALTGIGGGGSLLVTIVITDVVPDGERGTWSAVQNMIYTIGLSAGAPVGGLLADSIGWRWAFTGQVPICLLAIAATSLTLRNPSSDGKHWLEKARRIDYLGALTLMLAIMSLLVGQDAGVNTYWTSPTSLIANSIALPLSALFLLVERKYALDPIAPWRLLFDRALALLNIGSFCFMSAWFGILFYIPLFFQVTQQSSAASAGIRLMPTLIAAIPGAFVAGVVVKRTGKSRTCLLASYTLSLISIAAIILFTHPTYYTDIGISLGLLVAGLANGGVMTGNLLAALRNSQRADQAVVTSLLALARSLGSTLGLSLLATVLLQSLRVRLLGVLEGWNEDAAEELLGSVKRSLDAIDGLEEGLQATVRGAYGESIRAAFVAVFVLVAIALGSTIVVDESNVPEAED